MLLGGTLIIEPHPIDKTLYSVHFIGLSKIDYGTFFIGNLNDCLIYCKEKQIENLEREIEILKSQEEPIVYTEHE